MLEVISALKGLAIEARDGQIGTVVDFLFDDVDWKVRWLVVECGTWTRERKVLIHPPAITFSGLEHDRLDVDLTRAQVEASPSWLEHQPVSQQMQSEVYDYYGWNPAGRDEFIGDIPGAMASPLPAPAYLGFGSMSERRAEFEDKVEGDPHLRSVIEVMGYHVHALDGDIGHVENFIFESEDWSLHYFVLDTSNWWLGKRVLAPTQAETGVEWSDRHLRLGLTRDQVKSSPVWDPLIAFKEIAKTHLQKPYRWAGSRA